MEDVDSNSRSGSGLRQSDAAGSQWDGPRWTLAMCTLWIAQPLYDLVGGMPDYFLVRGLGTSDIWLFGLLAFLLPPLCFVAVAELVGRVGWREPAYRFFVALLSVPASLLVLRLVDISWAAVRIPGWLVSLASLAAAVAAFRLLRREWFRHVLCLLAFLAPLAPMLFFLRPEIRGELTAPLRGAQELPELEDAETRRAADAHIVVVLLDELPAHTLLDFTGRIDSELFPNLAELAATSTWIRNVRTPSAFTQQAVPAVVAGYVEAGLKLATARNYPDNLLTLLSDRRRVVSDEPITALGDAVPAAPFGERLGAMAGDSALMLAHAALPVSLCSSLSSSGVLPWPDVRRSVGPVLDPTERFEAFLQRLRSEADDLNAYSAEGERLLVFSHLLLPHHPWLRDEEGTLYDAGDEILLAGIKSPEIGAIHARWQDDWETVLDAYERHVLQTRHADRLVGRLLDLLREKGLFDSSMIVVTADHGIHFEPGESLRQPGEKTTDSLELVPFLLKMPGQIHHFIDDTPRSTLDVLPTILASMGLDAAPLGLPGGSMLDRVAVEPEDDSSSDDSAEQADDAPSYRPVRQRWLARRAVSGPAGFGPWYEELAGRKLRLGGVPTLDWVADLDRVDRLEIVSPDLPPPRRLSGRLLPRRPEVLAELMEAMGGGAAALPLGVGIDGEMVATTLSTEAKPGDEYLEFSVLLPASAVAPGQHHVVLYLLAFQQGVPLPPLPIPRRLESEAELDQASIRPAETGGAAGEARAIRLHGATAAIEIFGWLPAEPEVGRVEVYLGGQKLADASWIEEDADLGYRYRFGAFPQAARSFRAVVPVVAPDSLRLIARMESGGGVELPLAVYDEGVWRVTGPFSLHPDPRKPPVAYQNF